MSFLTKNYKATLCALLKVSFLPPHVLAVNCKKEQFCSFGCCHPRLCFVPAGKSLKIIFKKNNSLNPIGLTKL